MTRLTQSRVLVVTGLVLLLAGAVDPLEGSVVILGGSALVAFAAVRDRRQLRLSLASLILVAVGVGMMFGLTAVGGVGGNTGRSIWWILLCLPYPAGWVLGIISAATSLRTPRNVHAPAAS